MVVTWSILLALSVAVYAAVAAALLPRLFLKNSYAIEKSFDRGLKNVKEKNGRVVVYEPKPAVRKYIRQYLIADRAGKKTLLVKAAPGVATLDYDVAVFDRFDEVIRVLNVRETTEGSLGKPVGLPDETAYAALILNEADGIKIPDKVVKRVPRSLFALYALSASAVTVVEALFAKLCVARLFGGVFYESYLVSTKSILVTCALALAAVAVNLISALLAIRHKCAGGGGR